VTQKQTTIFLTREYQTIFRLCELEEKKQKKTHRKIMGREHKLLERSYWREMYEVSGGNFRQN
jgi:hypothetical protein